MGEIDANQFTNNLGYVDVLEGSLFNTSLASLIIATLWFFINLAMIIGVLLKRARYVVQSGILYNFKKQR